MNVECALSEERCALLAPLLADVERTGGVQMRFVDEVAGASAECTVWCGSGSGSGLRLGRMATDGETLAYIADELQELVMEERWQTGVNPAPWPECPTHRSHPLAAGLRGTIAVWECPSDRSYAIPIGEVT